MRIAAIRFFAIILIVAATVQARSQIASRPHGTNHRNSNKKAFTQSFVFVMNTLSDAWNEGNAGKAVDCFTEDAVYMEPPDRQVHVGRRAIYDFFGGAKKPEKSMHMKWHHLAFNEDEQVGYGEYTFEMNRRYHGIVTVLLVAAK